MMPPGVPGQAHHGDKKLVLKTTKSVILLFLNSNDGAR